jgi:hypothetical protein
MFAVVSIYDWGVYVSNVDRGVGIDAVWVAVVNSTAV